MAATEVSGPRILIVDDQKSNVRLLEQTLRRAGFAEVTSTLEPRDVAALHREHQYDLILLDLQMPQMNGFEVMEQLQQAAGADRLKILVLSADASQGPAALKAGANGFFGKPFRLPEVVECVRRVLNAAPTDPAGFSAAAPTLLR